MLIITKMRPEKKILLNGNDPFDEKSQVAREELVFRLQEDIKEGFYKVNECLKEYKELLLTGAPYGPYGLDPKPISKAIINDQKNEIINSLINKLVKKPDDKFHDVVFIVGEEKVRISANRYVLSGIINDFFFSQVLKILFTNIKIISQLLQHILKEYFMENQVNQQKMKSMFQ